MVEFTIKLVDYTICVKCKCESTREYCIDYLSEDIPLFWVNINDSDIENERELSEHRNYPDWMHEITAVFRKCSELLVSKGVHVFHCSSVAVDGKAYLFSAPSGVGKSTHTKLWTKLFGSRAVIINDDKPFLCFKNDELFVYGNPWNGKEKNGNNVSFPVKGICFVSRGLNNDIAPVDSKEAFNLIMNQIHRPSKDAMMIETIAFADKMCKKIKIWKMKCNMEIDAAELSYKTMSGIQESS